MSSLSPIIPNGFNSGAGGVSIPKINCDYVSILVCSPVGTEGNSYEYFLHLSQPTVTYGLVGTRPVVPGAAESWKKTADNILREAKLPLKAEGIIRLSRWFVPGVSRMSSHVVYVTIVKSEFKKIISSNLPGVWLGLKQVTDYYRDHKLLCPDVMDIIADACVTCANGIQVAADNEFTAENFADIEPIKPTGGIKKKTGFEALVHAAQFGRIEQELLYKEFLQFAAPYFTIGRVSFIAFMKKLDWPESALPNLFRTFDIQNRGGLIYRDMLYGLAAVEPGTIHGGPPAELRCRYIFRHYDRNGDGKLDFEEFKAMVADIRQTRGLPNDRLAIQDEASRAAKVFSTNSNTLSLVDFLTSVGQLKFRGTSHLLRSPTSLSIFLKTRRTGDPGIMLTSRKSIPGLISTSTNDGPSLFEAYDIAAHSVKVRKSGTVLDINSLWDIERKVKHLKECCWESLGLQGGDMFL